jgi:hypothetical protein
MDETTTTQPPTTSSESAVSFSYSFSTSSEWTAPTQAPTLLSSLTLVTYSAQTSGQLPEIVGTKKGNGDAFWQKSLFRVSAVSVGGVLVLAVVYGSCIRGKCGQESQDQSSRDEEAGGM